MVEQLVTDRFQEKATKISEFLSKSYYSGSKAGSNISTRIISKNYNNAITQSYDTNVNLSWGTVNQSKNQPFLSQKQYRNS